MPDCCRYYGGRTSVGTLAKYSCNDGYTIVGVPSIHCLQDGTWSGELPHCEGVRVLHMQS